jgi:hypothetical protein
VIGAPTYEPLAFGTPIMAVQRGADAVLYLATLLPIAYADDPGLFYRELGRRLRQQRVRGGITGVALASRSNIGPWAVSRAERYGHGSTQLMLGMTAALLAIADEQLRARRAARDVRPGADWAFHEHRTLAEVDVSSP